MCTELTCDCWLCILLHNLHQRGTSHNSLVAVFAMLCDYSTWSDSAQLNSVVDISEMFWTWWLTKLARAEVLWTLLQYDWTELVSWVELSWVELSQIRHNEQGLNRGVVPDWARQPIGVKENPLDIKNHEEGNMKLPSQNIGCYQRYTSIRTVKH